MVQTAQTTPTTVAPTTTTTRVVTAAGLVQTGAESRWMILLALACVAFGAALWLASNAETVAAAGEGAHRRLTDRRLAVAAFVSAALVLLASSGTTPV